MDNDVCSLNYKVALLVLKAAQASAWLGLIIIIIIIIKSPIRRHVLGNNNNNNNNKNIENVHGTLCNLKEIALRRFTNTHFTGVCVQSSLS